MFHTKFGVLFIICKVIIKSKVWFSLLTHFPPPSTGLAWWLKNETISEYFCSQRKSVRMASYSFTILVSVLVLVSPSPSSQFFLRLPCSLDTQKIRREAKECQCFFVTPFFYFFIPAIFSINREKRKEAGGKRLTQKGVFALTWTSQRMELVLIAIMFTIKHIKHHF